MRSWHRTALALAVGLVAALTVLCVGDATFHLEPGGRGFVRLVAGASSPGLVQQRAVVVLPGLKRSLPRVVRIEIEPSSSTVGFGLSIDRGEIHQLRPDQGGRVIVSLPPASTPGVRLDLTPGRGQALALKSVRVVDGQGRPIRFALVAGLVTAIGVFVFSAFKGATLAVALGLMTTVLLALASLPAWFLLTFPDLSTIARLGLMVALMAVSVAMVLRRRSADRRFFLRAGLLLTIGIFGIWIRVLFLPSAGSWDTDIWKAWMLRTADQGISRAYGDPGSIPEGHFWPQMRGEEEPWKIPHHKRLFVIDYPPLSMLLWKWSWWLVTHVAPDLDYGESQNVAVKLPAVLGDVAGVLVLLWALGARTVRGLTMAALYWALPLSWFSSAVLGYFDGAFAPLAVAAVVAGIGGRGYAAGVLLALAFWIKPLAVIVGPAVGVAIYQRGGVRVVVNGALAGLGVSFFVFLPYLLDGTVDTMVVHVWRIFAPGNLSSGYANLWWFLGQWISVVRGEGSWTDAVPFVPLSGVGLPLAASGALMVAVTTLVVCFLQLKSTAREAALLSAAAAFFSYCMLGLGVFENHPHLMFLLLLGTGLSTGRLRWLFAITSTTYLLNLFLFAGLGRFYGLRFWILEGWGEKALEMRMGFGFDLTLALVAINVAAFVLWLAGLRRAVVNNPR